MTKHKKNKHKKQRYEKETESEMATMYPITTTEIPSWFKKVVPQGSQISSMGVTRFYYGGGSGLVFLRMDQYGKCTVSLPSVSSVSRAEVYNIISSLYNDISKEFAECHMAIGQWFMFSVHTKKIVKRTDFIDYVPITYMKDAIFMDDSSDVNVYCLSDDSPYTVLQAACVFFAKRYLPKPAMGVGWTGVGKMLLTYMISKQTKIPGRFSDTTGSWTTVDYIFDRDSTEPEYDLAKMNTKRAEELASRIDPFSPRESDENVPVTKDSVVLLSDVLQMGVRPFIDSGKYGALMEIEIDTLMDTIKSLKIDTINRACIVSLDSRCRMTMNELEDCLMVSNIQLADSESVAIMSTNYLPEFGE